MTRFMRGLSYINFGVAALSALAFCLSGWNASFALPMLANMIAGAVVYWASDK